MRGAGSCTREPKSGGNQTKYVSHGGGFLRACQSGKLEIVKAVVEKTQVELDARNEFDMTPLLWTARTGHLRVVLYLCEQGGVKEARGWNGMASLHLAASYDFLLMLQYLCEQADKEVRDEYGMTALHTAAAYGHLPVVQYLCEQRTNKTARNRDDVTPLDCAFYHGRGPVVPYLCTCASALPRSRGRKGSTVWHTARWRKDSSRRRQGRGREFVLYSFTIKLQLATNLTIP